MGGPSVVTLRANEISLEEVHRLLKFVPQFDGLFETFLPLVPPTASEIQDLQQIRHELRSYLATGYISEGQARQIAINPLLRLTGYNRPPLQYRIEEDIARIYIEDKDTHIRGRFDIVVVNREIQPSPQTLLWILVIESKNIGASEFAGIAQMLTYAYTSLEYQRSVWGLVTNGANYQFFYIQNKQGLSYQYMPSLNLLEQDRAIRLLQVLNAIREWHPQAIAQSA